jgi:hypothetical protein
LLVRLLLTLIVIPSLALLGLLIPTWTAPALFVYIGLWIVFGGLVLCVWIPRRAIVILRVSAFVLGVFYVLAAIDTILGVVQTGQSPGARNPVFGLLVIGIPALLFAATGRLGRRTEPDDLDPDDEPEEDVEDPLSDDPDDRR